MDPAPADGRARRNASRHRSAGIAFVCAALAFVATPAVAQVPHAFPMLVRVEGFVGEKPADVRSLDRWVVAINGAQYTFHVTKLEPSVDVAYWNILNRLEPLPVTLTVYGDAALLDQFIGTTTGARVALVGNFTMGPGPVTLLLTAVEPLAPLSAAAVPLG